MHTVAPNCVEPLGGGLARPAGDPVTRRDQWPHAELAGRLPTYVPDRDGAMNANATAERVNDKIVMRGETVLSWCFVGYQPPPAATAAA
jgi:hypothetical protein